MNTSKEIPLQREMFTGDLVDNRSSYQKRLDKERQAPQQMVLFATGDMVQLGEKVRPWLSQTARPPLVLEKEDPRTPEEIERDLQREAEALTNSMFGLAAVAIQQQPISDPSPAPAAEEQRRILIPVYIADNTKLATPVKVEGYRKQVRQAGVRVRSRVG